MTTPLKRIGLDEWKAQAKGGEAPTECLLRKGFTFDDVTKLEDSADGLLRARFVISMGTVDRDNDVIELGGWDTSDYLKNPQVLWSHDYYGTPVPSPDGIGLPSIGLADELTFAGDKMVSIAAFQPRELNPLAHTVAQLVLHARRFIRAASVGFKPLKYAWNQERYGADFFKQLLLEWSICIIGSHPDALSEAKRLAGAKSEGIDLAPLVGWAEQFLDELGEPSVRIERAQAEAVYRLCGNGKAISIPGLALKGIDPEDVRAVLSGAVELQAADGTVLRTFQGAVKSEDAPADAAPTTETPTTEASAPETPTTETPAAEPGTEAPAATEQAAATAEATAEAGEAGAQEAPTEPATLEALLATDAGAKALETFLAQRGITFAPAGDGTAGHDDEVVMLTVDDDDEDSVAFDAADLRQAAKDLAGEMLAPLRGALTSVTGRLD